MLKSGYRVVVATHKHNAIFMVEPTSLVERDRAIRAAIASGTTDFFQLARSLGLNPKQDFAGADLSGTDLSGGNWVEANFTGTNFRGANFAAANLQGANFTQADLRLAYLGCDPESAFQHTRDLTRYLAYGIAYDLKRTRGFDFGDNRTQLYNLDLAQKLVRNLARNLAQPLNLARTEIKFLERSVDRARDLDRALDRSLTLDRLLNRSLDRSLALALIRSLDLALTLTLARASVNALERCLSLARSLVFILNYAVDRDSSLPLDCDRPTSLDRTHFLALADDLATFLEQGANVTGANFTEAKVEGAIAIGCQGFSPETAADLKQRGAIFADDLCDSPLVEISSPFVSE